MTRAIYIGYDPNEAAAFAVARASIRQHLTALVPIHGVILPLLMASGLYTRPTTISRVDGERLIIDHLSERPDYNGRCSTEFAVSRFFTPELERMRLRGDDATGWALFVDCDILARADLMELFHAADSSKAVMVVKHDHQPTSAFKMDGQQQTAYHRKNWSSVMLFNLSHPANRRLTVDLLNTAPGKDLHAFCWLSDEEIGELHPRWNYLVGHTVLDEPPAIVHFTDGIPLMRGYEDVEYSDEWRAVLTSWAR